MCITADSLTGCCSNLLQPWTRSSCCESPLLPETQRRIKHQARAEEVLSSDSEPKSRSKLRRLGERNEHHKWRNSLKPSCHTFNTSFTLNDCLNTSSLLPQTTGDASVSFTNKTIKIRETFCMFLKAFNNQSWVYLIKSGVKTVILWNITILNNYFLFEYLFSNIMYSCNVKLNFQHHSSSLRVTWSSDISLIFWFAAQETLIIIINVENSCAASYLCGYLDKLPFLSK